MTEIELECRHAWQWAHFDYIMSQPAPPTVYWWIDPDGERREMTLPIHEEA